MSTLWTPDGERPIRRAEPSAPTSPAGRADAGSEDIDDSPLSDDELAMAQEMERLQQELIEAPVEAVIVNHAVSLFDLARLHLSLEPPQLTKASLAIDAFSALVEGLEGRLGPDEPALRDGAAQLRMAFVQISAAQRNDPA
jgi:hypothetical protein